MSLIENNPDDFKTFNNSILNNSSRRIHSIDFLKGVSILIIILINTAEIWINTTSRATYRFMLLYLDVIGTSLFIFLFSLSVIFMWKHRFGMTPSKAIRNDIITRGLFLICLGVIYNLIIMSIKSTIPFPLSLWGWNVLVFIGFAQIISYYALKMSRRARWIVGFFIFFASTIIREILFFGKDSNPIINVLHFIIVSPNPQTTILPYIALSFFSTIFGERILECLHLDARKGDLEIFRTLLMFGLIFILIAIFYSSYPTMDFFASTPPGLFIRGTSPNLLYGLGVALILLGFSFYLLDIRNISNFIVKIFYFYGRVSLSLFFVHFIGLIFFFQQFNLIMFIIAYFIYTSLLGTGFFIWRKYARGVGTLNWFMEKIGSRRSILLEN